jgi:hypothetical protein
VRRRGYWSVGVLLGLAAAILLLVSAFLASPAGSGWLIETAAGYAPGTLVIEHIGGSLLSGLVIEGIDYRQDDTSLQAGRLELAIDPAGLLRGRIGVRRLAIEDAVYHAPAAAATSGRSRRPRGLHCRSPSTSRRCASGAWSCTSARRKPPSMSWISPRAPVPSPACASTASTWRRSACRRS